MWSLEGEQVSCLAADETTLELATGKPDGSITFWDTQTWTIKATLLSTTGAVSTIQYGRVKGSKLPATFVLVSLSSAWGVCSLVPSPCPSWLTQKVYPFLILYLESPFICGSSASALSFQWHSLFLQFRICPCFL